MAREIESWQRHRFVVPNLDGPISGGTVFNRSLLNEIAGEQLNVVALSLSQAVQAITSDSPSWFWVDSLYLDQFYEFHCLADKRHSVGLLVHYLPSLVALGEAVTWTQLSAAERRALEAARAFIVTSPFMRGVLRRLGVTDRPILEVEPGRFAREPATLPPRSGRVEVIMVANCVPNKGVLPFLQKLWPLVGDTDSFHVEIVGETGLDDKYEDALNRWLGDHSNLAARVNIVGPKVPLAVVSKIAASDLMVSASTMESYGMAMGEARTLGVPILAHSGGNIANVVEPKAGGQLVASHQQLALACLQLCRDPAHLNARTQAARRYCWPARSWNAAARDFIVQARQLAGLSGK